MATEVPIFQTAKSCFLHALTSPLQRRRTIFRGATPVYHATSEEPRDTVPICGESEEQWVWLHAAQPPRPAPSLSVMTVVDTGCGDDVQQTEGRRAEEDVFVEASVPEIKQLGHMLHHAGR